MITLALDASTYVASLAVFDGDAVLASERAAMRGADEERLLPAVAAVLARAGVKPRALDRIACGAGPGSFTSLRIAASLAKGLAFGADIPLHAVPSLALIVAGHEATRAPGRYVAAIDALRGEHYVAVCDVAASGEITAISGVERWSSAALRVRSASVGPLLGPALDTDVSPDVTGLPRLRSLLGAAAPVDLATWEPAYGRLAEAQVKWEAAHGRPLPAA